MSVGSVVWKIADRVPHNFLRILTCIHQINSRTSPQFFMTYLQISRTGKYRRGQEERKETGDERKGKEEIKEWREREVRKGRKEERTEGSRGEKRRDEMK